MVCKGWIEAEDAAMSTQKKRGPHWKKIEIGELSAEEEAHYNRYLDQPIRNEKYAAKETAAALNAVWLRKFPDGVNGQIRSYRVWKGLIQYDLKKLPPDHVFAAVESAQAAGRDLSGGPIVWLEYEDGSKIAGYKGRTFVMVAPHVQTRPGSGLNPPWTNCTRPEYGYGA
jgi:hypothetical protein